MKEENFMICSDCSNREICKYCSDTESYERNYKDTICKSPLDNLMISIVCKYKQINTSYSDWISNSYSNSNRLPYESIHGRLE